MSDLKKFAPILSEDETTTLETMSEKQIGNFLENLSSIMEATSGKERKSASLEHNLAEHFREDLIENILKTTGLSRENAILAIGGL